MDVPVIAATQLDSNDTILDIRHHVGKQQLRGALRYSPHALESEDELSLPLPLDRRIVLHVDRSSDAEKIAERLHAMGAREVVALHASIDECRAAGFPLEEPTMEQPVPEHPSAGIHLT